MHGVMRFWLDRGRGRVPHRRGPRHEQDPALPDDPPGTTLPHATLNDTAETHEILRGMRRLVDGYPGDRLILGEVFLLDTERVGTYYGSGDELQLSFQLPAALHPGGTPSAGRTGSRTPTAGSRAGAAGRRGCCPTTTSPATAPATAPRAAPSRAVPAARAAGLAGAVRGRAGPRGRDHPPDRGRPRRAGRLPGADPLDRRARPRLGRHRPVAAVAARAAGTWPPRWPIPKPSCTSTAGCWPPAGPPALQLGDPGAAASPPDVVAWRGPRARRPGWWRSTWTEPARRERPGGGGQRRGQGSRSAAPWPATGRC